MVSKKANVELKGIMPALCTRYESGGEVATSGLEEWLNWYLDAGCTGFFVGGSTGEGPLQSVEERCVYLKAVIDAVGDRATVIAHVGAVATADACEIARFASDAGADMVGSVLPIYYRVGPDATVDYYRAIAEAADVPVLVYYLAKTGAKLDPQEFASRLASIPQVAAMKYTSADLEVFRKVIELTDHSLSMVMGCDQLFLPALTMGADAAIGSTYNFMPEIFVGIHRHYLAGEIKQAQKLMERAFEVIYFLKRKYNMMGAVREILRLRGFDTGEPRPPLQALTEAQKKELPGDLEELGFFEPPIR